MAHSSTGRNLRTKVPPPKVWVIVHANQGARYARVFSTRGIQLLRIGLKEEAKVRGFGDRQHHLRSQGSLSILRIVKSFANPSRKDRRPSTPGLRHHLPNRLGRCSDAKNAGRNSAPLNNGTITLTRGKRDNP